MLVLWPVLSFLFPQLVSVVGSNWLDKEHRYEEMIVDEVSVNEDDEDEDKDDDSDNDDLIHIQGPLMEGWAGKREESDTQLLQTPDEGWNK